MTFWATRNQKLINNWTIMNYLCNWNKNEIIANESNFPMMMICKGAVWENWAYFGAPIIHEIMIRNPDSYPRQRMSMLMMCRTRLEMHSIQANWKVFHFSFVNFVTSIMRWKKLQWKLGFLIFDNVVRITK